MCAGACNQSQGRGQCSAACSWPERDRAAMRRFWLRYVAFITAASVFGAAYLAFAPLK